MRSGKLLQAILAGQRNCKFSDLERLLQALGFVLDRQSGSHRIFLHPSRHLRINVQPDRNGDAKPYQVRQLMVMIEAEGLSLDS